MREGRGVRLSCVRGERLGVEKSSCKLIGLRG